MTILGSLLNTIGYTRTSDGTHTYITNKGDTDFLNQDYLKLALENPVLSAVLNIRANYLSKARFYVLEKDGTKNFNDESLKVINQPNAYQSKEDFLKQYEWFRSCYGWVYQKPYSAVGYLPESIFNLKSSKITFPNDLGDSVLWKEEDVKEYYSKQFKYNDNDSEKYITFSEIIPFYDIANGLEDTEISTVTSPSKIKSIIKQLSNISLASDAENVVIQTNGRDMIFGKNTGKDSTFNSSVPLSEEDKLNISNQANNKYLLKSGSARTMTPSKELGWVDMSIKASDLGLHESINNNASMVAQAFDIPNEIYQSYKSGSTFENQEKANLRVIQQVSQPTADDLASSWTKSFGDENRPFKASFDHLPTMRVIEHNKADKALKITTAIRNLTQSGMTNELAIELLNNIGVNTGSDE